LYKAKSIYAKLALDTISDYIRKGELNRKSDENMSDKLKVKKACFVSLHKQNGELRGCIGTILPYRDNLYEEIIGNAISAATQDPRFSPVKASELDTLKISVDLLSKPELIEDTSQLDEKKYGVIVEKDGQRGLLLPDLDGVKNVEEQLKIAKMKAGIYGDEGLKIYRFTSTRYY